MNPAQRRRSTLGRRNRNNGEKPEKTSIVPMTRPLSLVTPKYGLGRIRRGEC